MSNSDKLPLVGVGQIAERAGVGKAAVWQWRARYSDFPETAADPSSGPVFLWAEVREWLIASGRSPAAYSPYRDEPPPEDDDTWPLVGLIEIAQRAGVQRPVVSTWRTRYADFPAPVKELHVGPVFWWPQVRAWLEATGRRYDCQLTLAEIGAGPDSNEARTDAWRERRSHQND